MRFPTSSSSAQLPLGWTLLGGAALLLGWGRVALVVIVAAAARSSSWLLLLSPATNEASISFLQAMNFGIEAKLQTASGENRLK